VSLYKRDLKGTKRRLVYVRNYSCCEASEGCSAATQNFGRAARTEMVDEPAEKPSTKPRKVQLGRIIENGGHDATALRSRDQLSRNSNEIFFTSVQTFGFLRSAKESATP